MDETEEEIVRKALAKKYAKEFSDSEEEETLQEEEEKPFSFLPSKKYVPKSQKAIIPPVKYEKIKTKFFKEKPDTDLGCIKYYYPTLEEFVSNNLPCVKRSWIIKEHNPDNLVGRDAYDDAMVYRPGQIYDYVQHWYIDHFEKNGIVSPFKQNEDNIQKNYKQICDTEGEYTLQPHQKFVGSHMSNMTDFGSLLIYHKIGSGKTCTSIVVAESNKGTYFKYNKETIRKGSTIPQRKSDGTYDPNQPTKPCNITVVVPKQTCNQYLEEIRGQIENGKIRSCTAACIYVESGQDSDETYVRMRQFYAGKINSRGEPDIKELRELMALDSAISNLEEELNYLRQKDEAEK